MPASAELSAFIARNQKAIVAEIVRVRGSSPREAGAFMLVSAEELYGTIGGGALEYMVIGRARQVLRQGLAGDSLDIPLGPEIGQCCGGRVELSLRRLDRAGAEALIARVQAEEAARPHVFVFGAGHVGKALANALALLPLNVHVIDTRPAELMGLPSEIEARAVALPEAAIRAAPPKSAYIIVTHDHALDFLIAQEALKRDDSPYIGMVGSASKRARFLSWYVGEGGERMAAERLVLPIGQAGLRDKRPAVIAALTAAELMVRLGQEAGPATRPRQSRRKLGISDGR